MGYKCPECKEEIDHLKYSLSVTEYRTEYGDYNLPENPEESDIYDGEYDCQDSDCNDSESGDDTEYRCPECDSIVRLSDLEKKDEDNDNEEEKLTKEEKEERKAKVIVASNKFAAEIHLNFSEDIEYRICGICGYLILVGEEDDEITCQECGNLITKKLCVENSISR